MALTKSQSTMSAGVLVILVLSFLLFIQWLYYRGDEAPQGETIRGPNPDGSWGSYAEPMVKVTGVQIDQVTNEATLFLVINIGNGKKYGAYVPIHIYPVTKEAKINEDSNESP